MSENKEGSNTVLAEAKDYLVQGKRFMALEDFQAATDCFEQSCQLFDAYYGVAKRECADAYFEYGLALVALANIEAGTGTDKLLKKAGITDQDRKEEESDEEENDENVEGGEVDAEIGDVDENDDENDVEAHQIKQSSKISHIDSTVNEVDMLEQAKDDLNECSQASSNAEPTSTKPDIEIACAPSTSSNEPQPGSSKDNDNSNAQEDEEEENEATSIEIAWEVLCLAKRLFMTDESYEGQTKLAETLQKLGEISIEWDNNDNAVSILQECLKIRSAILPVDDRLIAESYYHLGLAHSFKQETQLANESFQNAVSVIQKRIENQAQLLEDARAKQDTLSITAIEKEINQLKELVPEMSMRIDDTKDEEDTKEVFKRTRDELLKEEEELKKVCSDSKPADDITHLVKRKPA